MDQVEEEELFPFSPGQKVESKSNIKGFRGAWFRSEIKGMQIRRGEIWCAMQYVDFPDEKTTFMKAYQQDPSGKKKRVLMVRPSFPLISKEVDESMIKDAVEPVVVVNGDWWVGDLVDWFADGCFWAGKITAVINKELVQVELPSAPLGEGGSYEAAVKDIRPSLDWSIDRLWTVPSIKFHSQTLEAHAIGMPSYSLTSPVRNFASLNKEHIFIAKQEPGRVPVVQDRNNTFVGLDEAQSKRKSFVLAFGNEKAKVSDDRCTSSSFTHTVTSSVLEQFQVRAGEGSNVETVTGQHFDSDCARVTSFGGHRISLLESHRVSPNANAPAYRNQILPDRTGEQARSCQTQEQANQRHIREAGDSKELFKPLPQSNATDLNSKAEIDQNGLGKLDALNIASDIAETHLFEEFNALIGDGKLLDINDERVASSIVALEELISRVAWLKGVMQLGLKGWCKERRNRKWVFCEREGWPIAESENMEKSHVGFWPQ